MTHGGAGFGEWVRLIDHAALEKCCLKPLIFIRTFKALRGGQQIDGTVSDDPMRMTGGMVIQTFGLMKRFGRITAVDNLSIEVRRGHMYGLLAPNESDKTTTSGKGWAPSCRATQRSCA